MDELDPEKIGRSGIDPSTGSILSQDVRNALLKKSTFDASIFRNELLSIENRRKEIDLQNNSVIQSQEQTLIAFNSNIQSLRMDIGKLGVGLENIALLLKQEGSEEQARIRSEQEKQRILSEQNIRIGKENEIEQKIQNALIQPIQKLVPSVNDIFGKIGSALTILFGGWLTNQVVQSIKASEEGNTVLFNDIKFNILKNIGIIFGGLVAIKTGFGLIKKTISSIASGLTRLLIAKPLASAASLFQPRGKTTSTRPSGPSRGGGLGKLLTGLSSALNLKNKEYIDATLSGLSLFSRAPGVIGGVAKIAGVAFTMDEIAEAFGKNIFGDERDAIVNKAADAAKREIEKSKSSDKQTISSVSPKESIVPQQNMIGNDASKLNVTASISPPDSSEMMKMQEGKDKNNISSLGSLTSSMTSSINMSSQTKDSQVELTSAKISNVPSEPQQVGQLPEPKPSLTMISTSNKINQSADVPLTSGKLSDVPLVNSSNPDNFYVLYSQLNYNVVI